MSSLFSAFDPNSSWGPSLNWVSLTLVVLMIPNKFWLVPGQLFSSFSSLHQSILKEFEAIMGRLSSPLGSLYLPLSLFVVVLMTNVSGLIPYVFPGSSHLPFVFNMAFPLWVGYMLYSWVFSFEHMMAHLVPLGTPSILMPFMVLIELVSLSIRPLTLAVRLVANMTAGHLLLTLLGSGADLASPLSALLLVGGMMVLCLLESGVSVVQAYVLGALSTLYISEVASTN